MGIVVASLSICKGSSDLWYFGGKIRPLWKLKENNSVQALEAKQTNKQMILKIVQTPDCGLVP